MTATRDRRSDPEVDAELAWDDRPIVGQFRGLPWWAAVLLAFGLTAIAAFVDMQLQDTLGKIYQGAFAVGCVGAVCLVRRRSLFGPMVQPPLIFAITAVGAVALLSDKASGGGMKLLVSVALPLTSNFPTMGITTGVVVLIGLFRWWRERDPDPEMRPNTPRQRGADIGLDDEPGQGLGGRGRERSGKDRAAAPPRRSRPEMEELPPPDDRAARRTPGRTPRPTREPAPGREGGREARRRDSAAGRPERGRGEPPAEASGRGRGRGGEPSPRRREPGAEGGRSRDERGRRDTGRDGGREGRGGTSGRQPRRRPPEDR
ncbi:DUF6542 domain-containing protein [Actinophytocola algeriensis]|uniref:DUF6542 domain-containing protein n=1 Tax=Actinophytocola algeriensis TaxID=1768010 RepID=A0A7W7QE81_9PSEU|nr:DUF6542 domain-containing protein [Actinophytocola algeriensis]MBB4911977.1 hypothetical protein [Actinophytocola algeriensis]MBE1477531.1 hypothetical protein [Actinophytocola algeriensis]